MSDVVHNEIDHAKNAVQPANKVPRSFDKYVFG
jgi:hypothetical protein